MFSSLTLFALFTARALAVPCAAHVEGERILLADPLAFQPRTAELTPESAGPVQGIACLLGELPELTVQVEVHTDARGAESYNLAVSQARADAVRAALLAKGIAPERVTAVGYGEAYPVEHEDWAQSQALSRRIELWTSDPATRPPRPELEPAPAPSPQPAPKPPPALSLCESLALATTASAGLVGAATCDPSALGWRCVFAEPADTVSDRVQACAGGQRDGDELYASWRGGTLAVKNDPEQPGHCVVSFSR